MVVMDTQLSDSENLQYQASWNGGLHTLARILERGITLVHPYSRNKSDNTRLDLFFLLFLKPTSKGNGEMKVT